MKHFYLKCLAVLALVFTVSFSANAQCTGITAPFTENFDGLALTSPYTALPTCWAAQTGPDYWDVTNGSTNSPQYLANFNDHTTGSGNFFWIDASSDITGNEMVTPDIDLSSLTTPYAGFWFGSNNTTNTTNHTINLDVWDGTAWVNIATESGNFPSWVEVTGVVPASIPAITKFRIYATAASGTTSSDYYQNDLGVDDFFVVEAPTCLKPTLLTATNITSSGADFGWTDMNGATSWEIESGASGFTQGTGTTAIVSSNPTTITTMAPATSYDLYVRAVCAAGDSSDWEGPINVTTACLSTLSGAYTIGGVGADFADVAAAVTTLNTCGISGAVTFNIAAGSYAGEISIGSVVGASPTNTITFDGGSAATTTITYDGANTQNATIVLDGADYVTFQNLTIENTESASYGWGVHLINGADFNTIDNCIINIDNTSTASSFAGVISSNSNTSTGSYGNNANNTTVSNTTINGGYYGVRYNGLSATYNTNNVVTNCTFTDIRYYHIYNIYQDAPVASGNTCDWRSGVTSGYGIYMNQARHSIITGNTITGAYTYGIYLYNNNTTAQAPTQRCVIANNMISALNSGDGIYLSGSDSVDVYYNTVTAENDQALWINSTSDGYDVRNNVFAASGTSQVIDLDAAPTAPELLDYNVYYHSGGGDIVIVGSTTHATLAAWKTDDPAQNVNSLEGDPSFLSATDLHLVGTIANDVGTPIATITTDIDGDTRSATTPDIGADEYTPPSCSPPGALTVSASATSADLGWTAGGTETMWDVEYGAAGFTPGAGTMVTATTSNPYTATMLTPNTAYEFYVRANCGGATSPWIGPFSFTTPCVAYTVPYFEGFESGYTHNTAVAGCLTQESVTGTIDWTANNTLTSYNRAPFAGSWNAFLRYGNEDWLYIPIDLTSGTSYTFEAYARQDGATATNSDVTVSYGTTNNAAAMTNTIVPTTGIINGNYQLLTGTFTPTTTGTYYIGIKGYMNGSPWYISLDNISVIVTPSCPAPNSLTTISTTATDANVDWTETGAATAWEVQYDVTGFALGTGTVEAVSAKPHTITGLMPETTYDYYVRSICGPGDTSTWSVASSFTTACLATVAPFTETFDGLALTSPYTALPNCWDPQVGPDYWDVTNDVTNNGHTYLPNIGDHTTGTGNYMWLDASSDVTANEIVTPLVDMSALTTPYAGFFFASNNTANSTNHTIGLDAWDGSAWVNIASLSGNFPGWVEVGGAIPAGIPTTTQFRIYATADTGTTSSTYYQNDLGIDDFFVGEMLSQSSTTTDVLCIGASNGSATITATGGFAPYSYAWSNGATTMTTMTLSAGVHYYTVTDAFGLMSMDSVTIGEPAMPMSVMTSVDATVSCNGAMDAAVSAMGMNGTAPYSYTWTNGATMDSLMSIGAGTYAVLVTDANGCNALGSVTVSEPDAMSTATMSTDITCNGAADGTAMTTVAGGTGAYTYAWSNAATTDALTGLAAGTYSVTATDANGCMVMDSVMVAEPAAITASATTDNNVDCNGAANGGVTVTATGGTGMLSYMWSNGATMASLTNLSGGTYDVTVTDANGCTMNSSATVTEATALVLSMSSMPDSLRMGMGSATATVTGGTAPYTYAWSNGGTTETLTGLVEGLLTVTITDANGCTIDGFVDVADVVSTDAIDYLSNLSIYPNPARGNTVIDLELSQNADVAISVFTITGVLVQDFGKENTSRVTQSIDVSTYAEGMYLVRFVIDNQVVTEKLIVTK